MRRPVQHDHHIIAGPASSYATKGYPVTYERVLLKLSGEVFGGGKVGVDPDVVQKVAREIATVVRAGTQIAIVTGGGNFFRGAELQQRGMDRVRADSMGMRSEEHTSELQSLMRISYAVFC